jgi:hypothetical protein
VKVSLVELRLQNFRQFRNLRWAIDPLTFLIGRNGAGKTTLLDAVEFLRESVTDGLVTALRRRNGLDSLFPRGIPRSLPLGMAIVMEIEAAPDRTLQVLWGFELADGPADVREVLRVTPDASLGYERIGAKAVLGNGDVAAYMHDESLALPVLASADAFRSAVLAAIAGLRGYAFDTLRLAEPRRVGPPDHLAVNGVNGLDFIASPNAGPVRAAADRALTALLGVPVQVGVLAAGGWMRPTLTLSSTDDAPASTFDSHELSSGTLGVLATTIALEQPNAPTLAIFDELEHSLHPSALGLIPGLVEEASERFPIIVTTHSTELLRRHPVRSDQVRILEWSTSGATVHRLGPETAAALDDGVDRVGDLLSCGALWTDSAADTFDVLLDLPESRP